MYRSERKKNVSVSASRISPNPKRAALCTRHQYNIRTINVCIYIVRLQLEIKNPSAAVTVRALRTCVWSCLIDGSGARTPEMEKPCSTIARVSPSGAVAESTVGPDYIINGRCSGPGIRDREVFATSSHVHTHTRKHTQTRAHTSTPALGASLRANYCFVWSAYAPAELRDDGFCSRPPLVRRRIKGYTVT